eukprot:scaffold57817_cov30-Tisochrysis_lutea.AAC.1
MKSTGINGSPKYLMVWVPGWFWVNMMLTSAVFFVLSYRVFKITVVLRDACIPKDNKGIAMNALVGSIGGAVLYGIGLILKP